MLTWHDMEAMRESQVLCRWQVPGGQPARGRALYMTPNVHLQLMERPWPAIDGERPRRTQDRRSAMLNVLGRFVRGDALVLEKDIKELGSKRADDRFRGYWEFRSQGPMTETRLFGFFPRPGAFLGTFFAGRDEFGPHADPSWLSRRRDCQGVWDSLTRCSYLTSPWIVTTRAHLRAYTERTD